MADIQMIRSFYESVNKRDMQKCLSLFSEDGQFNDVSTEKIYKGTNSIRGMMEEWMKVVPDLKLQVKNVVGAGDTFAVELELVGTHKGTLRGPAGDIPATGKTINVPSCDIIKVKNGRIQSLNCYLAATVMMSQIGAGSGRRVA